MYPIILISEKLATLFVATPGNTVHNAQNGKQNTATPRSDQTKKLKVFPFLPQKHGTQLKTRANTETTVGNHRK